MSTAPERAVPMALPALPAPRALLLDFGGVVVTTTARATWARDLSERIVRRARTAGIKLEDAPVERSLRVGRTALSMWKNAASRRLEPRELTPREIVADFLLADLPQAARSTLALDAHGILAEMAPLVADHATRPGIPELIAECRSTDIPLAIVSNAHSGRAHRQILDELGLADAFGVQVYSDEVGIRKPHPGMVRRAAHALGLDPADVWYVGDTHDRDVVAGRRAGAGAVVITRDRRTDEPPFAVADAPDLTLDTPADLLEPLREVLRAGRPRRGTARRDVEPLTQQASARPLAVLLDHGGVLTASEPNPDRDRVLGELIAGIAERIGHPIDRETAQAAMADGWERHRDRKRSRDASGSYQEITPAELWGDLVGADLPEPLREALRIEAPVLSYELHRSKSRPAPRDGALDLVHWCRAHDVVVGIVSNTVSGRSVRRILDDYGIGDLIGPAAYSDEIGVRKPGRAIFDAALAGLDVDRADVVYVGDKALNDGRGGRDAGIGTICLLRGGKDTDAELEAARKDGLADHVLDGPRDVITVLTERLRF